MHSSSPARGTPFSLSGCNFEASSLYGINSTYLDLSADQYNNLSLIVDNTFFPCNGGAYQSEVYLYQVLNLTIESNASYLFVIKLGTPPNT